VNNNWSLNYNRDGKKIRSASWQKSEAIPKRTAAVSGAVGVAAATKSDTLKLNFVPSKNTNADLSFSKSPSSRTSAWTFSYGNAYNQKMRFDLFFNVNNNAAAADNRTNYRLTTSYKVTPKTSLDVKYDRILSTGNNEQKNTNFSATIRSSLN
jgi:hypothetical protein